MPLVYHTQEESSPEEPLLVPTDADDSIVLSDLVRTGETSRLRRRGAMRLDYTHRASNPAGRRGDSYPSLPAEWDPPEAGEGDEDTFRREWDSVTEPVPVGFDQEEEEMRFYTLYCGGNDDSDSEEDVCSPSTPYKPSPLPIYPRTKGPLSHRRDSRKTSNGCGAVLHTRAVPRKRCGVWAAKSDASDDVVSLDESYFDKGTRSLMILRSGCGCIREGVGCAVCGNILGTRYRTCQAASDAFVASGPPSPRCLVPEGPDYLRPRQPASSGLPTYVYTFFSKNVTPSPSYDFPSRTIITPPPLSESPEQFYIPSDDQPTIYSLPPPPQGYATPPDRTSPIPWPNPYVPFTQPHYVPRRSMTPVFRIPDSPTSSASASPVGMPEALLSRFRLTVDEMEEVAPELERGRERERERQETVTYDSDGEIVGAEPSSPEKSAAELPLWSGR
ncbi:hypothetical protein OE88DRAFT_1728791 [Heliocybe sulcata]|uniref:Uncharacterized protein n=1 Tax=Heliocybe sulcata TaxID=5364 RepID=A0A5C3MT93_9AGAM|nr:hypothetical protein OE88DRAFT_1728791 [Heliocybe sulcata]